MKKIFVSLCVLACLFALVARADDDDDAEDLRVKAIDSQHVSEMRHNAETAYLQSLPVGTEIDEDTRAYIDWRMASYEGLIRKELPNKLRWKFLVGPTGIGKTEIDRSIRGDAIKFGFEEETRNSDEQGDPDHTLNLGAHIAKLERTRAQLDQLSSSKGYRAFKTRWVYTRGSITLDEATFSKKPSKDPIKDYQKKLRALQAKYTRSDKKREALRQLTKPTPPKREDFGSDSAGFLKAQTKYRKDFAAYEVATARAPKPDERSFEDAAHELRLELDKELAQQEITRNEMAVIWQAASGGWVKLSLEKEPSEKAAHEIEDAYHALNNFLIAHKNSPLFERLKQIQDQIDDRQPDVDRNKEELVALARQKTALQEEIAQFESLKPADIEEWLRDKGRLEGTIHLDPGKIPDFLEQMVTDLRNKPHTADQGIDPSRTEDVTELTKRFRQRILEVYGQDKTKLQERDETLNRESTRLREEISLLKKQQRAFADTQTEGGLENTPEAVIALIHQYEELSNKYRQEIRVAAHLLSGRDAIEKKINGLTVQDLKAHYRAYYDRLVLHNNHGEPQLDEQKADEGVAAYLNRLKQTNKLGDKGQSNNLDLKLTELMRMDPEGALKLVKDAITNDGWLQKEIYLGNIDVQIKYNDLDIEKNVQKKVERVHNEEHREVTYDEFRGFYEEELVARREHAREMLQEYFPELYEYVRKSSAGKGNQGAADRRFADAIFFRPKTTSQMVTAVATTIQAQFEAWKRSMKMEHGLDVDAELFLHRNVPAVFLHEGQRPERGVSEAVVEVRYAMGKLLTRLTRDVLKKHQEKPNEPLHYKLVLADEANAGKLHDLTLRYTDPDFRGDADRKHVLDEEKRHVIKDTPLLGERVGRWSHNFKPLKKLYDLGQVFPTVDHFPELQPKPKTKAPEVATHTGVPVPPVTHDNATSARDNATSVLDLVRPDTGTHDEVRDTQQAATGAQTPAVKRVTEEEARNRLRASDAGLGQWQTALRAANEKRTSAQSALRQLETQPHTTPAQERALEEARGKVRLAEAEVQEAQAGVHAEEARIDIEAARTALKSLDPALTQLQEALQKAIVKRQAAADHLRQLESQPRATQAEKRALEQAETDSQAADTEAVQAQAAVRAVESEKARVAARVQENVTVAEQANQAKTGKTQERQLAQQDEASKQAVREQAVQQEGVTAEAQRKDGNKQLSRLTLELEDEIRGFRGPGWFSFLFRRPTEKGLKRFYDKLPTQELKDTMLKVLFEKAARREDGATMSHVYQWLDFEFKGNGVDPGRDVDDFLRKNFDEIQQNSSKNLAALFSNLATDPQLKAELRKKTRPGVVGRVVRKTCGWAFGRIINRGVPTDRRVPDYVSQIFGGRR